MFIDRMSLLKHMCPTCENYMPLSLPSTRLAEESGSGSASSSAFAPSAAATDAPTTTFSAPASAPASAPSASSASNPSEDLLRVCRNCGYKQAEQKGLVMETIIQEKASEAYYVFINKFTREDPRLPHLTTIPCPNEECDTKRGVPTDTIYIKYDPINMKYLYICNVCETHWRSR